MSNALTRAFGALNRFVNGAMLRRDNPMRYSQVYLTDQPAGVTISMDSALCISVVWACVMALTNAIARSPWHVYTRKGARREMLPDDPLEYLLNVRPNKEMTAVAFREALSIHSLTWGNGYAEIQRDLSNRVIALWPLMTHRMQVRRDPEDAGGQIFYEYAQMDGGLRRLEADDVYHLHGPGVTGLMGDNLVARMVKAVGLAAAQERFASAYFGNNTQLGGVLEYPKKLSPADLDKLRNQWADRYAGPTKAHKPAILEDGMTWKPIEVKASDAQLVEGQKFSIEQICRYFGVPPHKVMHLDRATFNNIEQQNIEFVGDGVLPWTLRWAQEADYKLLSDRGAKRSTAFDTSRLMQGDFKTRAEGYQIMRRIGVYSANDILMKEGENHIGKEGDVRLVEANMVTLDRAAAATAPEITPAHVDKGIATPNEARGQLKLKPHDDPGADDLKQAPQPASGGSEDPEKQAGGADGKQTSKETPAKGAQNALLDAINAVLDGTFGRYVRRLENRSADLQRSGVTGAKAAVNLAEERIKLRSWLIDDAAPALQLAAKYSPDKDVGGAVLRAADQIDNGADLKTTVSALAAYLLETA